MTDNKEALLDLGDRIYRWLETGPPTDHDRRQRRFTDPGGFVLSKVRSIAASEGLTIVQHMPDGAPSSAQGAYCQDTGIISVNPKLVPYHDQAGVLVHELSHHFTPNLKGLYFMIGAGDPDRGIGAVEFVGEAAANCVAQRLGIGDPDYSALYCAGWATNLADTPEVLPFLIRHAKDTAERFELALDNDTAAEAA